MEETVSFEEIVQLAKRLTTVEKARLIEQIASDIERALQAEEQTPRASLLGVLSDLGPATVD